MSALPPKAAAADACPRLHARVVWLLALNFLTERLAGPEKKPCSGHLGLPLAAPVTAVVATTRRASSRSADLRWKGRRMQMGRHAVYP